MKIDARITYSIDMNSEEPCIATILFVKENDDGSLPIKFAKMFNLTLENLGKGELAYREILTERNWPDLTNQVEIRLEYIREIWQAAVDNYKSLQLSLPSDTTEIIYADES